MVFYFSDGLTVSDVSNTEQQKPCLPIKEIPYNLNIPRFMQEECQIRQYFNKKFFTGA